MLTYNPTRYKNGDSTICCRKAHYLKLNEERNVKINEMSTAVL